MGFILQSSRQRELKKKKERKKAGINPPTSISVLLLCNYPCMGRNTKKEEPLVLDFKKVAILLGLLGSGDVSETPWEVDRSKDPRHPQCQPTLGPRSHISLLGNLHFKHRGFWWGLGFRTTELKRKHEHHRQEGEASEPSQPHHPLRAAPRRQP